MANANSPGTISVLLGKGDGTLQSPVDYATAQGPEAVKVGDFNGDGKLDLAVAAESSTAAVVSVLLGRGDGTFQTTTDYPVGAGPTSIIAADLNKDGKLDLAVVNHSDSSISVLLGNGNGTFQTQTKYNPGHPEPMGLVVGDFNGDGINDLAVANNLDNTVILLLGKGDGTFPTVLDYEYSSAGSSFGLVAADLRADGNTDLVVANFGFGYGRSISVLLNSPIAALSPGKLSFSSLAVGDSSSAQSVQLSNPGAAPFRIESIAASGDFSETNGCASKLLVGANCTINVTFAPTGPLSRIGAVVVSDGAFNNPRAVFLNGIGIGPAAGFSPAAVTFAGIFVGASATQSVTLTNTGNTALMITSFAISGDFGRSKSPSHLPPLALAMA